jgi:hypothetical protein
MPARAPASSFERRKRRLLLAFLCAFLTAGCAASETKDVGELFVVYRDRLESRSKKSRRASGVIVYLVNRSHGRLVKDGQPVVKLLGLKVVNDGTMAWCLERLTEHSFFENASPAADLSQALLSRPRNQIVVVEHNGETLVLTAEPPAASDPVSVRKARRFARIKMDMIRISQEQTSFQVVPNKEGGSFFSQQCRNLLRHGSRLRGRR